MHINKQYHEGEVKPEANNCFTTNGQMIIIIWKKIIKITDISNIQYYRRSSTKLKFQTKQGL